MPPKTSNRRKKALKAKEDKEANAARVKTHAMTAFGKGAGGKPNNVLSRFARNNVKMVRNKRRVRVISEQSIIDAMTVVDQREQSLDDYLSKTLLKKRIVDAVHSLLHLQFLPKNPYAYLTPFVRRQEIQADLKGRRVESVHNKVVVGKSETSYVSNIRDSNDLFGIAKLLKYVDRDAILELYDALHESTGLIINQESGMPGGMGKEPHCKSMTVLAAPTIFYGSIMPYIDRIELNHEFFITSKKFEMATREFGNQIIRNLFEFRNANESLSEGVYVTHAPKIRGSEGEPRLWTHHEIQTGRASFLKDIKEAVVGRREIYIDAIVWLHLGANHGFEMVAVKREKEMQGIQEDQQQKKKGGKKGIVGNSILARAAAKSAQAKEAERRREEKKLSTGSFYRVRKRYMFHSANADDESSESKSKSKTKKKSSSSSKGANTRGSEYDPRVSYPGRSYAMGLFQKQDEAQFYTNAFGAKNPEDPEFNRMIKILRSTIEADISKRHHEGDWVACYERMLILIVWNSGNEHAMVSQIFNSLVGQMRQLSLEAQVLRDVLTACIKSSEYSGMFNALLLKQYANFFKRVSKLIGGSSALASMNGTSSHGGGSRSSILSSLKLIMRAKLGKTVDEQTKRLKLEKMTVNCMDSMSRTFRVIELSLAADAIPLFPGVESLTEKTVKDSMERTKKKGSGSKGNDDKKEEETNLEEVHVELVLNVAEATRRYKKTNKFPPKVLREATILQYIIDARVDLTLQQIYQQLLSEPLYPNPYPRVTILLQSAWARHEFWTQTDAEIEKEISSVSPEIATASSYTYIARGGNESKVFGTLAAVRIADAKKLCNLFKMLPELRNNTDVSSFKKSNKEQICTGLAGRTALEFRVCKHDEDLPSFIECHEHYIITGIQARTAIRLFVEHVIMYASWLHIDTPHLVTRLSTGKIDPATGNSGTRANFNVSDLKKGSAQIRRELIRAANNNDGIFLHGLVRLDNPFTPQFMLLRKWFFFHWRDPGNNLKVEKKSFILPTALHQCVYFTAKEASEAVNALQDGRPDSEADPMSSAIIGRYVSQLKRSVGHCMLAGDVLNAYHEMVPLAVVEESWDVLCDLMRMLSSIAELVRDATFENRVLQELVSGFTKQNIEDTFKGKVSLAFVKGQVEMYGNRCQLILKKSGDTFVAGAQTEILSTINNIRSVVGSTDQKRVEEALVGMRETQSVLVALAAIVADAIHSNCGHLHEHFSSFVDILSLEGRR